MARANRIDFSMKKEPTQARAQATVKAIIQACAQILEKEGYGALSTNEIARVAGVSIGSVYEYFPGKEAIVASMTKALIDTHLKKLHTTLGAQHDNDFETAMRHWVGTLYHLLKKNKKILQALIFEVPYFFQLFSINNLQLEVLQVVLKGAARSQTQYQVAVKPEVLYLICNLTGGTLFSLVFAPMPGLDSQHVLDELTARILKWLQEQ